MIAVRHAAMTASRITPLIAPRTKTDWSASGVIFISGGTRLAMRGSILRTLVTHVEGRGVAGLEDAHEHTADGRSCRAMLVWTWKPSPTVATSRR